MSVPELKLHNFAGHAKLDHADLFTAQGLLYLDSIFNDFLHNQRPDLATILIAYRQAENNLTALAISEFLLEVAPIVEEFVIKLFNINDAALLLRAQTIQHNPVALFKKNFMLRRLKKQAQQVTASFAELDAWLVDILQQQALLSHDKELAIAIVGNYWLTQASVYHDELSKLAQWCQQALASPEGQAATATWTMMHLPQRFVADSLIAFSETDSGKIFANDDLKARDGFKLIDPRMNAREIQAEAHYCIYCHDHQGDFCAKGLPLTKNDYSAGFKKNALAVELSGCPLEEKISEMNYLKQLGHTIAPLAVIMIDNPMCPATGHRICNDCMKSCIYQKQDPVNIPQIETRVLTDVLSLPWGVEIYDLLTRWNPLRSQQWCMREPNGLKILIAGMGPAGFTMAHHLLQEGCMVVGVDGLKIEPLPQQLLTQAIYSMAQLTTSLDDKIMAGFGGVMEYGITARWDKKFLRLIYLSLSRRPYFQVFGNIRFGGSIRVEDAWSLGFDHLVLAIGAGLPKALNIPHSLARGMRQANDFLMALHLSDIASINSLSGMQIRLPAIIIGGGLTGVDTATEVQAYYIAQVEKILLRYEQLITVLATTNITADLDPSSQEILAEFLRHGRAVRAERLAAAKDGRQPNFNPLIKSWGGVTIVYRRKIIESPAYINNHEELRQAFVAGIHYRDCLEPITVQIDQYGDVASLVCHERHISADGEWQTSDNAIVLAARAIFVATGTQANVAYEFEHRGTFVKLGNHYQHYAIKDGEFIVATGSSHCKDQNFGAFTSYNKHNSQVSLIGDSHPVFHGSVVKAIASAMRSYPKILGLLQHKISYHHEQNLAYKQFSQQLQDFFSAKLLTITQCAPKVLELTIKAPMAAAQYHPGQFYRLQNFATNALLIDNTLLQLEPLALMPIAVNKENGTLKFLVFEYGATSKLCRLLRPEEPLALMGPTGVKLKLNAGHETILIIGGEMAIPLVLSYGCALLAQGSKVIFLAMFQDLAEFSYCQQALEQASTVIIWNTPAKLTNIRAQDCIANPGTPAEILQQYNQGALTATKPAITLAAIDRIYLIGDSELLRNFQLARRSMLKTLLSKDPVVYGSVHGPMQCMLKGLCAQCLQWQIDPETGQRTKAVFACSWQDQPLEMIDINHLTERLSQNKIHEHLANLWVDYLLTKVTLADTQY
jgi:NADPH-dependent glutamate synthase beta subunit-like oxidoreductase